MTDIEKIQQIYNIVGGLTSYSGDFAVNDKQINTVDEVKPKFLVKPIPDRFEGNHVQGSEFFKIELAADNLVNLETQIKDILALQSNASAGYNVSTSVFNGIKHTIKIILYTDDISRNVDDEAGTIKDGDHGRIAAEVP